MAYDINISIHAPREGSDRLSHPRKRVTEDFYPRSPRGERHHLARPRSM